MARRKEPRIPDHLLDQLLAGADAQSAFAKDGLLDELKKALAERALNAEMDHHLDQENSAGNSRNGYGRKTVLTDTGKIDLEIPRDRLATVITQALYERRFHALTVARIVPKTVAPGVRRAVSTTVRIAASPSAAHVAR